MLPSGTAPRRCRTPPKSAPGGSIPGKVRHRGRAGVGRPADAEAELEQWLRREESLGDELVGHSQMPDLKDFELRLDLRLGDQARHPAQPCRCRGIDHVAKVQGPAVERTHLGLQLKDVCDPLFG